MEKDGTPFGLSNHSRAGSAFIFATAASESRESLSLAAGRRSRHRTLINLCSRRRRRHQSGRNLISWTGVITLAIVRWNQPAGAESCRHCWGFLDEAAPLFGAANITWVVVFVLGEPQFRGAAANKSRRIWGIVDLQLPATHFCRGSGTFGASRVPRPRLVKAGLAWRWREISGDEAFWTRLRAQQPWRALLNVLHSCVLLSF